jgi:hypothetical protein
MSISKRAISNQNDTGAAIDPFDDPVSYLSDLGIEAELIEVRLDVAEAA